MNKLIPNYSLLAQQPDQVELRLQIDADLHYFAGHFPKAPVLAGIAQLDWAVLFSQQFLCPDAQVCAVEVLKFQQMIQPGSEVLLVLTRTKADCSIFSYQRGEQHLSSGRLKWTHAGE